jgi:hypothetical protein
VTFRAVMREESAEGFCGDVRPSILAIIAGETGAPLRQRG